jgi:zinc protease
VVRRERQAIVAELRGRASNPADAAILDMDRAFFGAQHPWGRPTVGTPQTLERITLRNVDDFLRDHFTPERTLAAVAGPVEEGQVRAHLIPLLGSGPPAAVELTSFRPAERPVTQDYNSITTWVSASFRFPETGDEEALRFVAYLVTDQLSFSASQRSVFNVWSEVVPRVGAGELRLQVVVPPREAQAWARRLSEVVPALAADPMLEDVFAGHLRRYNGERVMKLLSPEDRAHAAVRQLLVNGRFTSLLPDLDEMTQERMRAAARSLSRPTVVLLGPTLDN